MCYFLWCPRAQALLLINVWTLALPLPIVALFSCPCLSETWVYLYLIHNDLDFSSILLENSLLVDRNLSLLRRFRDPGFPIFWSLFWIRKMRIEISSSFLIFFSLFSFIIAWTFISLQIKEFRIMGLSINDSVYSCLFFFLTGLHFFHLLVGLFLCCLLFWSCSFSFLRFPALLQRISFLH